MFTRMFSRIVSKEEWALRQSQWAAFHRWEASREPEPCRVTAVIDDLGTILSWLPEDVRLYDADPEKLGIRRMHTILAALSPRQ